GGEAADRPDEFREWADYPAAPGDRSAHEPESMALRAAEESLLAAEVGELAETVQTVGEAESVETLGGDEVEEVEEADAERRRTQPTRHYKIQEVVKRRQIMLVQVAKEEHTSDSSHQIISYAVFCLKKKRKLELSRTNRL